MTAPALSRTTRGGGRVYVWKGREYPSVTSIIGATVPKPALVGWGIKTTAGAAVSEVDRLSAMVRAAGDDPCPCSARCHDEKVRCGSSCEAIVSVLRWLKSAPYRDRDKAANVGTAVHAHAEAIANGLPSVISDDVAPFVEGFERFLSDWHPEYIETEATVFSDEYGYAGTLDAIARIPGLGVVLLDTKTSKSGVYPETALQLAAYEAADFIGRNDGETSDSMPEIEATAVLHLRPEGYRLVPLRIDHLTHAQWRRCVATFGYLTGPHLTTVGLDLTPGGK
jgi:hypothetical protein